MSEQPVAKTKPMEIGQKMSESTVQKDDGYEGASTSTGNNRKDIALFIRASWLESEGRTSDGIYHILTILQTFRCSN